MGRIEESAVDRATSYLDFRLAENEPATLWQMIAHVDAYEKLVITQEEVNEALNRRSTVFVRRTHCGVEFASTGSERSITVEDWKQAHAKYHEWFWTEYKKLEPRKDS